jgi:hypothetical protein
VSLPFLLLNQLVHLDEILFGDDAIAGGLDVTSFNPMQCTCTIQLAQQWVGIV